MLHVCSTSTNRHHRARPPVYSPSHVGGVFPHLMPLTMDHMDLLRLTTFCPPVCCDRKLITSYSKAQRSAPQPNPTNIRHTPCNHFWHNITIRVGQSHASKRIYGVHIGFWPTLITIHPRRHITSQTCMVTLLIAHTMFVILQPYHASHCACIATHTHTCTHARTHTHTHTCTHAHMRVHTHTHTHTHTLTHTHTTTQRQSRPSQLTKRRKHVLKHISTKHPAHVRS